MALPQAETRKQRITEHWKSQENHNKPHESTNKLEDQEIKRPDMASRSAQTASATSFKNPKLNIIPEVEIDKSGKFKYILIKVHDPDVDREFKHIVRGFSKCAYHADIFDQVVTKIEDVGLDCEVLGGGRIEHEPSKKSIKIYGYSQGYGQADHSITHSLILRKYKDYDCTWSNDGY